MHQTVAGGVPASRDGGVAMQRGMDGIAAALVSILICAGISAAADEQAFSISKDIEFTNGYHRLAVNSTTGDVVAAWLNVDSSNIKSVYTAFCQRLKNGKFKVKKAILLSRSADIARKLDVQYNPMDDSYLVVWDAFESADHAGPQNIFAQRLSNRGRKRGSKIQVTESGKSYACPEIHFIESIPVAPPPAFARGFFLFVYDYRPSLVNVKPSAGVYRHYLTHEGKRENIVPPAMISEPFFSGAYPCQSLPQELTRLQDGSFVLALRKYGVEADKICPFLLKISKKHLGGKQIKLCSDTSMATEFIQLTNKMCVSSWQRMIPGNNHWVGQLFRPKLKKVKQEFEPVTGKITMSCELVKLEDDPAGYQLACEGQYLWGREVSPNGNLGANVRLLFDHNYLLDGMDAVCLPGSNRIFVSWNEINDDGAELRAFIFNAK